jgi:hypothetical protein
VSTEDRNFKLAVIGGAALVVAVIAPLRFCRTVELPAKPPPPRNDVPAEQLLASTDASPRAWRGYVERDAQTAGLAVPSPEAMARALPYRLDDTRRTLEPGASAQVAGLQLSASVRRGDGGDDILVLAIENPSPTAVAYRVATRPNVGTAICHGRSILPYDAMVIGPGATVRRSECAYRKGMYLHVDRVEVVELAPLPALYVSRVAPPAVGLESRLALGHRPVLPRGVATCAVVASRGALAALEAGTLGWRDLVDFYARHRCDTYSFPDSYRAFTRDGERPLPVVK